MSLEPNPANETSWMVSQMFLKFKCILIENEGGKKMGVKQQFFHVIKFFASFCTISFSFTCNLRFCFEMDKTSI